jgi:hypothetical protein
MFFIDLSYVTQASGKAMPRPKYFITDFSPWRHRFPHKEVHMGFVVGKEAM